MQLYKEGIQKSESALHANRFLLEEPLDIRLSNP
jgi:hypothetical protein